MCRYLLLLTALFLSAPASAEDTIRVTDLPVNDVVYHSGTQELYCTVPGSAGLMGNSLVRLNPATGEVVGSTLVGSEPGSMALSVRTDELYIILNGSNLVRRFNVGANTLEPPFGVGQDRWGQAYRPLSLALPTEMPGPLCVGLGSHSGSIHNVGYYNGTFSSKPAPYHFTETKLQGTPIAQRQYLTGFSGSLRLSSDQYGLAHIDHTPGSLRTEGAVYHRGLLYTIDGEVVDPETGTLVATVSGLGLWGAQVVLPDSSTGRIYYLTHYPAAIRAYDISTYQFLGSYTLENLNPGYMMTRWGANGLAITDRSQRLVLIDTALVPTTAPRADIQLSVSPLASPQPAGSPATIAFTVTNAGPDVAHEANWIGGWEREVNILSVTPSQGTASFYEGVATARLGSLEVGQSATVTVKLAYRLPLPSSMQAFAQSVVFDPNRDNQGHLQNIQVSPTNGAELEASFLPVKGTRLRSGKTTLTGSVIVKNTGLGSAGPFRIKIYSGPEELPSGWIGGLLQEVRVKKLLPGRTLRVRIHKKTYKVDYLYAELDPLNAVVEANERNNLVRSEAVAYPQ